MELDLSGIDLFDADKITFDKRKTYLNTHKPQVSEN